eukprot:s1332_g21.t2
MKEKIPSQILNPEMLDQSFLGPDPRFLRSHCCLQTILCWSSAAAFVAFILGARLMQKKSEEPGQAPVPKQYVVTGVMVAPQKDDRSPLLAHWVGGRVTRCCQRPVLPVQTTASLCRAACEANAAFRDHMEDSYVIIDPFFEQHGEHWGYFAIYDGHGGRQAVDFCETKLHGLVLDELRNVTGMAREPVADEVVGEALSRAFRRMDERLKLLGTWRCGCTATVVLARRTASGLRLHSANVGDSRAIVLESGSECRLSQDHRQGPVLGASCSDDPKAARGTWPGGRPARGQPCAGRPRSEKSRSDGHARAVVERTVAKRLQDKVPEILINTALRAGSTDNTTALVAFFGKETVQLSPSMSL